MELLLRFQEVGAAWAAALATSAAAAVALWIAGREQRLRRQEKNEAAQLIAAGTGIYLHALLLELSTAGNTLRKGLEPGSNLSDFLKLAATNLGKLNTEWLSSAEVAAFHALPNLAGEKIYAGVACIRSVQSGVNIRLESALEANIDGRRVLADYWRNQVVIAHNLLLDALRECDSVSRLKLVRVGGLPYL